MHTRPSRRRPPAASKVSSGGRRPRSDERGEGAAHLHETAVVGRGDGHVAVGEGHVHVELHLCVGYMTIARRLRDGYMAVTCEGHVHVELHLSSCGE